VERRGLFATFVPSIFTPLHDTRLGEKRGVQQSRELSTLQWQIMMKCWKLNSQAALQRWWSPIAWRVGALLLWLCKLRKINGPNFTWPLLMFARTVPERLLIRMGKIYGGQPMKVKSRKELLETIKRPHWKYLRADNGDLPDDQAALQQARFASAADGHNGHSHHTGISGNLVRGISPASDKTREQ
jgi:hypothetical protein